MTLKEAKSYIAMYCSIYSEVNSWAVEGVISSEDALKLTDKEIIIDLGEDLQQQVREEIGYLMN